jgi:dUTP pyrophosphatase
MKVPLDCMGHLYPRSSLVRMGCSLDAGLFDSGFVGRAQVLLTVKNPAGVKLYKNARVAQMVYHTVEGGEVDAGYSGTYQESE